MVSKTWAFTLNNYTEEDEVLFQTLECTYICYGREVARTGTRHLQGVITFPIAMRLSGVRKIHPKAHWEITRKCLNANRAYCRKEGDFFEKKKNHPVPRTGQPIALDSPHYTHSVHGNHDVNLEKYTKVKIVNFSSLYKRKHACEAKGATVLSEKDSGPGFESPR